MLRDNYREIWLVDFEFYPDANLNPSPVCLVAWELKSGKKVSLWKDEFGPTPPYSTDSNSLLVAYTASAEIGCHLSLGWAIPERILDLYTEFRCLTNDGDKSRRYSLLAALLHFGIDCMSAVEKDEMRQLILAQGPWSPSQQSAILTYCESDVIALSRLLPAMEPKIDLPRALLRGRYMAAAACIERTGTPLDIGTLERLKANWDRIKSQLISRLGAKYGVYENGSFKYELFARLLQSRDIAWPMLPNGRLDLSDNTFREMALTHPDLQSLYELRYTLGKMRLKELPVGTDGRNKTMVSAFRSKTGRNQPGSSKFIFGPSTWLRGLIKPPAGYGVAYIDWQQQEFGIAAALSGDMMMQDAYLSGDPYLAFAKQAGAVPVDATKSSHKNERELYKQCVLAVQYGMGEASLAQRIGKPPIVARNLLRLHRETYKTFWKWSDDMLDQTMLTGTAETVFGWPIHVGKDPNDRSLRNFPMQANGAEMLRLACCMAVERGIEVCAPVHDAVLIAAPLSALNDDVQNMQAIMADASRIVLDGFALGTDAAVIRTPDRYMDARGAEMWGAIMDILDGPQPLTA